LDVSGPRRGCPGRREQIEGGLQAIQIEIEQLGIEPNGVAIAP
jgi:hypothetical protein